MLSYESGVRATGKTKQNTLVSKPGHVNQNAISTFRKAAGVL